MFVRSTCLAVAALAGLTAAAGAAQAQAWPQRNVKFIVPLGPGAGVDITSRMFGDRLSKKWGQPVVIENRPGGDAVTGISAFLSANDDHVLLFMPAGSFTAHPYLHAKMPYDASQVVPIARVTNTIVSFSVPTALGVNTVKEFVERAKKEPGKLNWASTTGLNDFQFQSFVKTAGIDVVRVPYRDTVQAMTDIGENRIQAYTSAYAIARPQVQSGKAKVIAITGTSRAEKSLPGIPTVREAGFPVLEFDGLVGIFGLPSMPAAVREQIANDVKQFSTDPEIVDRLTATGQVINPGNPAEFAKSIDDQRKGAAETAKIIGLKASQ